uniref:Putative alpha-galactosidase/alpha-n-acetylgalactosaminidase n=2 Tax=Ixodes ricinus TaxID=34613 RepID=V5H2W3_IXORI
MALWAILAAPLLMSNDLRRMRPEFKQILLNKDIIAVNQDPLGRMGQKVQAQNGVEIWRRPITPLVANSAFSFALVAFNRNIMGGAIDVPIQLKSVGLLHGPGYRVTDLFESKFLGVFRPEEYLVVKVNPSGVAMVKAEAIDLNVPAVPLGPVDVQQQAPLAGGQAVGNLGVIQALPQPSQVLQDNPAQRPGFLIHTGSQGFRQRRSSETEREDARDK